VVRCRRPDALGPIRSVSVALVAAATLGVTAVAVPDLSSLGMALTRR
jgi:hypothetical protein